MGFVGCGTRQRLSLCSVPFPQVTAFYYVMALLSVSFWHGLRREDSRDASRPPPTTHKKKEPRMAKLLVCPQVFFLSCDKMSIAEAVRERESGGLLSPDIPAPPRHTTTCWISRRILLGHYNQGQVEMQIIYVANLFLVGWGRSSGCDVKNCASGCAGHLAGLASSDAAGRSCS